VTGKQDQQSLLAHEIAHQWFGNMATEKAYPHLWLSEGFATYFEMLYGEKKDGMEEAASVRESKRKRIIAFVKNFKQPVVDSVSPTMDLLNPNSYQKGGWILYMLRRELGDSAFHKGIQTYYTTYAGKNADTRDLQHVLENVSGKDLSVFFQQWLYTPGIPQLDIQWKYDRASGNVDITVKQLQKDLYQFPLELGIAVSSSPNHIEKLLINQASQHFSFPYKEKPFEIKADPLVNLLFDGKVTEIQ
jgi:aminopeptidase N